MPEGEATFYESDVGEDFGPVGMCSLPIAFSGEVYMIVVLEYSSGHTQSVAAYLFDPGGAGLSTAWYGEFPSWMDPSIGWTGEVFLASFPVLDEGNLVMTFSEAGENTRTEMVDMNDEGSGGWDSEEATKIMCPTSGPFILDFGPPNATVIVDVLRHFNFDGSFADTEVELDLPPHITTFGRPACAPVGPAVACFYGLPPLNKPNLFFLDREGNVWGSPSFPETTHFEMGGAIADLGEAAAIFWFDTPDWGDHINMCFTILGLDALVITPPTILDLAIERDDEMGLSAATSGTDVLVAGPTPDELKAA